MTYYTWPGEARAALFLSVNFDAEALDLTVTTEDRLYGRYGYGRYGTRVGAPRLLAVLAEHSVRATFFVCAADAERHPDLVHRIMDEGHEIAARGLAMESLPSLGDREFDTLRIATDRLEGICGVRPLGFRAPGNALSVRTLEHLAELGYEYDSSFQDDDYPYRVTVGDKGTLLEIPTCSALEDAPVYSARHTHTRLSRIWNDEFDAMAAAGTLVPLTVHLRGDVGSTRAARIAVLDSFLRRVRSRSDVVAMAATDLLRHAASSVPRIEPDPVKPHLAQLREVPFRGDLAVSNSSYSTGTS